MLNLIIKEQDVEEKYYVDIKDDFGKTQRFEVSTLDMKEAINNIDNEIKE